MKDNCGIYCFCNLVNGCKYIGKSVNIKNRKSQHLNNLRKNQHHSHHFQNTFNKYGENSFLFGVIEFCNIEDLDSKERYYIDLYDTYNNGFNEAIPNGLNSGHIFTDEDKAKHSVAMKLARSRDSEESRNKILAGCAKGRINARLGVITSLMLYKSDTHELIYKSESIGDCANFLNVRLVTMQRVMRKLNKGRIFTYKGYIIIRDNGKESLEQYLSDLEQHNLDIRCKKAIQSGMKIINKQIRINNNKIYLAENKENRLASWQRNLEKAIEINSKKNLLLQV